MRGGYNLMRGSMLAAAVLQFLLVPLCFAQQAPSPDPKLPAGVEIKTQAEPRQATVGDPIRIELEITLPEGYEASLPKLGSQLGDFAVLEFNPGPSVPPVTGSQASSPAAAPDGGKRMHRARIVAALYRTGEFEFPPLQVTLRPPGGTEFKGFTPPVKIRIQSVLTDKDPQLKDLKSQAEIREPVRWLLWLAAALLLLIISALAWWYYRRRHAQPAAAAPGVPQVDPLVLAEAELRDLAGRGLMEKGHVKQFYVLLSDIVKKILEAGYEIQTVEKTTSEILEELQASPRQAAGDLQRIESVLFECDLVKFAKYVPSKGESDAAVNGVFRIIESARRARAAAAPTGEPLVAGAQ